MNPSSALQRAAEWLAKKQIPLVPHSIGQHSGPNDWRVILRAPGTAQMLNIGMLRVHDDGSVSTPATWTDQRPPALGGIKLEDDIVELADIITKISKEIVLGVAKEDSHYANTSEEASEFWDMEAAQIAAQRESGIATDIPSD